MRPRRLYVTKDNRFYYLINGKKKFIKVPEGMSQKQLQKVNITNIIGGPAKRLKKRIKKVVPVYDKKIAKGEDMQKSVIKTETGLPTYIFTPQKKFLSLGDLSAKKDTNQLTDLIPLITEGVKKLALPAPEKRFLLGDTEKDFINEMIEGKLLESEPAVRELIRRELPKQPKPPLQPKSEKERPSPKVQRLSPVPTPYSTPLREEEGETLEPPESFNKRKEPEIVIPIEEPSAYKETFDTTKVFKIKYLESLDPTNKKGFMTFINSQIHSNGKKKDPKDWPIETLIEFGRLIGLNLQKEKGIKKETLQKAIAQKLQGGSGKEKYDDGLYNDQIEKIMKKRIKNYVPVVARDKVDDLLKHVSSKDKFFSAVINTDPSGSSGRHWRCIVIDNRDDFPSAEYFDPLVEDFKPEDTLLVVMRKIAKKMNPEKYFKYKFSLIRRQSISKSNCGYHCMKFIEDRYNGIPYSEASGWDDYMKMQKGKGYEAPNASQDGEGDLKSYEKMIKKKFNSYI